MEASKLLKSPYVLIGGGALVLILILASRGGSSGDGGNDLGATLASQQITSATNSTLAGFTTQQNVAAMQIEGAKALAAWDFAKTRANNDAALAVASLRTLETFHTLNTQGAIAEKQINAGITNNRLFARTAIERDRIAANLTAFLAPFKERTTIGVAQIEASAATRTAQISADSRYDLAQLYALSRVGSDLMRTDSKGNSGLSSLLGIAGAVGGTIFGGPAGGMAGASIGSSVGSGIDV